jgi:hypothetical protein
MGTQQKSPETRYGQNSGSGSNEPKHHEKKEQHGWVSRQGGDQTRQPDVQQNPVRESDSNPKSQGDETKSPAPTAQRPHLEGSEQGPA